MANENQFQVATTSLVLSIPPIFAGNPRGGVEEILDSMIMRYLHSTLSSKLSSNSVRYLPALQGVVLSHSNLRFLNNTATIRGDSPFLVCTVVFDATVWSPRVGIKLCTFFFFCSYFDLNVFIDSGKGQPMFPRSYFSPRPSDL